MHSQSSQNSRWQFFLDQNAKFVVQKCQKLPGPFRSHTAVGTSSEGRLSGDVYGCIQYALLFLWDFTTCGLNLSTSSLWKTPRSHAGRIDRPRHWRRPASAPESPRWPCPWKWWAVWGSCPQRRTGAAMSGGEAVKENQPAKEQPPKKTKDPGTGIRRKKRNPRRMNIKSMLALFHIPQ